MYLRRLATVATGIILGGALSVGAAFAQTAPQGQTGPVGGDTDFMNQAWAADRSEIAEAQMALRVSQNPAVRAFAQRMIQDHSLGLSQVDAMAKTKGVALSRQLPDQAQTQASNLQNLSGQQFDFQYARDQIQDHLMAIDLFQKETNSGGDMDIRNLAGTTLPMLKDHLRLARSLESQVGGQ
jgi:putative membrane protein